MTVTDKQVEAVLKQLPHDYPTTLQPYVVKRMIEAAMQAAWVKFDINDESTYPPILPERYFLRVTSEEDELVLEGVCGIVDGELIYGREGDRYAFINLVTHWMPLPEYKGE